MSNIEAKLPHYLPYEGQALQSEQRPPEVPTLLVSYQLWIHCVAKALSTHPRRLEILQLFMDVYSEMVLSIMINLPASQTKSVLFSHLYYKSGKLWLPLALYQHAPIDYVTGEPIYDYIQYLATYIDEIVRSNEDKTIPLWSLLMEQSSDLTVRDSVISKFMIWYITKLIDEFGLEEISVRLDPKRNYSARIGQFPPQLRTGIAAKIYAAILIPRLSSADFYRDLGLSKEAMIDLFSQWYKLEVSKKDYDYTTEKRDILSYLASTPMGTFDLPPVPEPVIKIINPRIPNLMVQSYDSSELSILLEELYLSLLPGIVTTELDVIAFNKWLVDIKVCVQDCIKTTTDTLLPLPPGAYPNIRELVGSYV